MDFAHCGLKSCMVFEGSTGVYKRILSFQIQMGRKEKNANSKWILIFFFMFLFYINLSNNDIISWRQGLKSGIEARSVSGRKNDIFWPEIGSRFGEPKGTPSPKIPMSTPLGMGHVSSSCLL